MLYWVRHEAYVHASDKKKLKTMSKSIGKLIGWTWWIHDSSVRPAGLCSSVSSAIGTITPAQAVNHTAPTMLKPPSQLRPAVSPRNRSAASRATGAIRPTQAVNHAAPAMLKPLSAASDRSSGLLIRTSWSGRGLGRHREEIDKASYTNILASNVARLAVAAATRYSWLHDAIHEIYQLQRPYHFSLSS
jgi:hypothetical protein